MDDLSVEPHVNVRNICHYEDQHLSRLIALAKLNYNCSEYCKRIRWANSNITTSLYSQMYNYSLKSIEYIFSEYTSDLHGTYLINICANLLTSVFATLK